MSAAKKIAVMGASGIVGNKIVNILEERKLPVSALYLFSSTKSAGQTARFNGQELIYEAFTPEAFDRGIDIALFAVNGTFSKAYAPLAVSKGCIVIDNSSAWRMDSAVPLIVPEVNGGDIKNHKGIIANPNCCACPAVVALKPLHDAFGLKRVVISTYQSVSGAGIGGMKDLTRTLTGESPLHFPYPIAHNLIPHIDTFGEDGYTGEEKKLMGEVQKILHLPDLAITATTVRVPVYTGHSLSINVTLENSYDLEHVRNLLTHSPGIKLLDNPTENLYPMPITAEGNDWVHIGRLRRDDSCKNSLNLWVVCDNIRKGAATNAVQIAEGLCI
jgi:aspartate-semialdehyde dehydrogenase